MPRRSDCSSLRAAYAELLDLKQRCKLAIEEAKRTGNVDPATKLVMLCRKKAKELGKQVNPFWEKVDVSYKMPSRKELKKRFLDYVSPIFDGRPWEPIEACKHISREPRKIRFEYFEIDQSKTTEQVLAEMEKQGLRPALPEELVCFVEHYPDEPREGWIVALGSSVFFFNENYYATLFNGVDGRCISIMMKPLDLDPNIHYLVVRVEDRHNHNT